MRMQSIDTTLQKGEKQFPLFFWQDKEGGWNPARFCETKTWWHLFSLLIHTVINLRSAIEVQWESEIHNQTCHHQNKCFMLGKMVLTDNYRNWWHSESWMGTFFAVQKKEIHEFVCSMLLYSSWVPKINFNLQKGLSSDGLSDIRAT